MSKLICSDVMPKGGQFVAVWLSESGDMWSTSFRFNEDGQIEVWSEVWGDWVEEDWGIFTRINNITFITSIEE